MVFRTAKHRQWSAWRFITWFGVVSLLGDFVYEGARSVTGPYLQTLGASAVLVGLITGFGEMFALVGRLGSGPLADRTRAYWPIAIAGYALTIVSVPMLGLTSVLWLAAALIIAERAGKALRSPAKDVMLSHAASQVGRGRGFGVHEALDQTGAMIGPLVVALVLGTTGSYARSFGVLAVPGIAAIALLLWVKRKVPDPARFEDGGSGQKADSVSSNQGKSARFSVGFWWYMAFTTVTTSGFATFGLIGYHLVAAHLVGAAVVPVIYAATMAAAGMASLANGWLYDRIGRRSLVVVPILTFVAVALSFSGTAWIAIVGALVWGLVLGIQESTMRAAVADLVPSTRRGTAYGLFAVGFGVATLIGGVLVGALYDVSVPVLIGTELVVQMAALAVFGFARTGGYLT